jgi:hypothetical protein
MSEAIAETVQRRTMKFVATKTADQLDLQVPHRVRERLVRHALTFKRRPFLPQQRKIGHAAPSGLLRSCMAN